MQNCKRNRLQRVADPDLGVFTESFILRAGHNSSFFERKFDRQHWDFVPKKFDFLWRAAVGLNLVYESQHSVCSLCLFLSNAHLLSTWPPVLAPGAPSGSTPVPPFTTPAPASNTRFYHLAGLRIRIDPLLSLEILNLDPNPCVKQQC